MYEIGSTFEKHYEVSGNEFDVHVQYQGFLPCGHNGAPKHTWLFVLSVKNHIVEQGPYYNNHDRELTDENVANHIASFWGTSKKIADAQELGEDENQAALDAVVQRCAEAMFRYYMQDEPFDYDIISKHMDEYGWEVMLMPNVLTAKKETPYGKKQSILSFKQFPQHDGQYMTVYDLTHSVYTKL
jgi:hypothetical protein